MHCLSPRLPRKGCRSPDIGPASQDNPARLGETLNLLKSGLYKAKRIASIMNIRISKGQIHPT